MHHLYLIEIQGGTKNVAGTKISGGGVFDKVVTEPEDPTVLGSAIDQMKPMPPKGSKKNGRARAQILIRTMMVASVAGRTTMGRTIRKRGNRPDCVWFCFHWSFCVQLSIGGTPHLCSHRCSGNQGAKRQT